MSLWQFLAAAKGYARAHGGKPDKDAPPPTTDDMIRRREKYRNG